MWNDDMAWSSGMFEFGVIAFATDPYPTLLFQASNQALTVHEFL